MSLLATEEETLLADNARKFLDEAAPVSHLRGLRDNGRLFDEDLWQEMAAMGWAGVLVPESSGGADMGHAAACLLAQEMGRTLVTTPFISTAVIAATVLRGAGARFGDRLAGIVSGESCYAVAVDEGPKHAPDQSEMQATRKGNGYVLNGQKMFVLNGAQANRVLVLARAQDGFLLFDLDCKQLESRPRAMIDASDAVDIDFNNVEATGDDLIGAPGQGLELLEPGLMAGQAALAANMTGLAQGAFAMTLSYLSERKQFGVPIGGFQVLQHRAAHLWSDIELTTSCILNAGRQLDAQPDKAALAVSLAKARACKTATLAVQEGVQMHGGIGMTDAYDIGFYIKRARVASEWLGDYGYHAERVGRLQCLTID